MEAFQQYTGVELAGRLNGFLHVFNGLQIHRHTLALFAIQRLDHNTLVLVEKLQVVVGTAGQLLGRKVQACGLEHLVGQALVLAQSHADGAGQVAEGFAAAHPAAAMAKREHPGLSVIDVHIDATSVRFFDNDPRVWIELGFRARAEKQRLVDTVLALDGERRKVAETQLGVEVFRLAIVMQHRQVEVAQPATHEMFDQVAHQHFTDAGP